MQNISIKQKRIIYWLFVYYVFIYNRISRNYKNIPINWQFN